MAERECKREKKGTVAQPRLGYETTEPKDAEGTREEAGVGRDAKSRPEKVITFWGEDRAGVAKRRPWPTTSAGPTGPPDYSRLSDRMGRAAGASFGRGKAQGQSPGRPPGPAPAPRPDQPSRRRSPPDGALGDRLKSQSRSAPPARACQRTLSCDWRGGWLRPPRGRRRRKAGVACGGL